jgi:hypothetical protein
MRSPAPVRVCAERVNRSVFSEDAQVGEIRFIARLDPAPADGGSLWVGGANGAARFAPDGSLRARVTFDERVSRPEPIDVRSDGTFRTIDRGGGWSAVGLPDEHGRTLWHYPPADGDRAADAMAAGRIGPGGGSFEILHTDDSRDALQVRDAEGGPLRAIPAAFRSFSLVHWPQPDSPLRVLGIDA